MTDTRTALAQALDALIGAGIVMTRSIAAGRIGERYSYIQARDGSMIEATAPINTINAAITAAEAALAAPQEPVAWMHRAENGNIVCWTSAHAEVLRLSKEVGFPLQPLYAAPAAPAHQPLTSRHIAEPYALAEIRARIASNEYSAELLLQHAMLLLEAPARAQPTDEQIDAATEAVRSALQGAYICGRAWYAWGYGTMDEGDFTPADESDLPGEIARAVLALPDGGRTESADAARYRHIAAVNSWDEREEAEIDAAIERARHITGDAA